MADLAVTITSLPANNGASITDVEYRVDGGSPVSSGGITSFTIIGLTPSVAVDIELRAVNSVGAGAWSDVKSGTPASSGGGGADDPSTIFGANLVAWYEAADLSNGAVSSWPDKSGHGFNLIQPTSGNRPVKAASSFNGLPGVTFDGSDDILEAAISGVSSGTTIQVFIAFQSDGASESGARVISTKTSGDVDYANYIPLTWGGSTSYTAFSGTTRDTGTVPNNTPTMLASILNGTGTVTHEIYVDGATDGVPSVAYAYPSFSFDLLLVGGSDNGSIAENFSGVIASIIVVKGSVTSGQITDAFAWLAQQNGL